MFGTTATVNTATTVGAATALHVTPTALEVFTSAKLRPTGLAVVLAAPTMLK